MMKRLLMTSALLLISAGAIQAQATSDARIRVQKDAYTSSGGAVALSEADIDLEEARLAREWYRPGGTVCSSVDMGEVRRVSIESDLYNPSTMISPDSAKMIALCAVPGQIGSGEMEMTDGRAEYEISIIPAGKETYSKVIIDAQTGAVLSTKQFGGVRGFTGWLRESWEHKRNTP
jgi:uncharacterized membrane protein YkoI